MQSSILLKVDSVTKLFPGVRALDNVTFEVRAGEVHALVGENGAGKSTLMGVASGALMADEGSVAICGERVLGDPEVARDLGLAIVRQEPALMPDLTVSENLYLGVPPRCRPPINQTKQWARELLGRWSQDVSVDPGDRVNTLNPEQRFIVEIVKALAAEPKVLVLDEPTEHLLPEDVERLFQRIKQVTARECAVVYISHRIREVQKVADRLTVLRDGQGQGTYDATSMDEHRIVELIVGGELDREFPAKAAGTDSEPRVLEVKDLRGPGFSNVNMHVRRGEIVGLAGIDANGQREFMRALAGILPSSGHLSINGKKASNANPIKATSSGIRYLPGDRHQEGILAELSVRENFSLRSLFKDLAAGLTSRRNETQRAQQAVDQFAVKTPNVETPIGSLSGGNQQKLVLASVLAGDPKVLLVDEPTQGVDIGTRMEIYKTLRQVASRGVAVIVVSSDQQEIAGLCDRVMIFSRGHVVKELSGPEVVESKITAAVLTSTTTRERTSSSTSGFWKWTAGDLAPIIMLAIAIIALGAYTGSVNEYYFTERNLAGVLPLVATLALVAFGQQILMLVGGIDLSVGPLMGLVLVLQSFFLIEGAPPETQALGWTIVLGVVVLVGTLNWILVDPLKMHPMVATLVTFMALQAVSLQLRPIPGGLFSDGVLESLDSTIGLVPLTLAAAVILGFALEFGLFRSRWGLSFRGLGSRPEAARVAGIKPRMTRLGAYIGCSLFAGLAAIPMMAQVGSGDPNSGTSYTLTSIAAVVIGGASLFGGRGSFIGALLGALLITQVNVVTSFLGVTDAWQSYLLGGMILASVALYSKSRQMAVAK
ncbi:ATP-binding cassette domain-containing protein [Marinobacterium mangrovicola]|uniref:Ribose transport system ATP-binding protein n=1 Tax=Marinobacterium mangrovicola TaxID=1476959 RepID=A0A4V2PEJ4_9GAMM|nr:ATP-binding cassette domain-containing protein [Marinobacterium mangrovicola]TCK09336.1 ribose transport system ATP-binding protein [Marinobacterium mangrovicola]